MYHDSRVTASGDNENEEGSECAETEAPADDSFVDEREAAIEAVGEEEETDPRREGQASHDEVEAPGHHCTHLALLIPKVVDNGSTRPIACLSITAEPPHAQYDDVHGEGRNAKTKTKEVEGVDEAGIWESGVGTGWEIPKRGTEEFELVLDLNREERCGREDRGGLFKQIRTTIEDGKENADVDKCGFQGSSMFLDVIAVMFFGCAEERRIELGADVAGCSRGR